jgi:hypothetical protein
MRAPVTDLTPECESILKPGERILLTAEARGVIFPERRTASGQIFLTDRRLIWIERWASDMANFSLTRAIHVIEPRQVNTRTLRRLPWESALVLRTDRTYRLTPGRLPDFERNRETAAEFYSALERLGYGREATAEEGAKDEPLLGRRLIVGGVSASIALTTFAGAAAILGVQPAFIWILPMVGAGLLHGSLILAWSIK